jgi:hypothetical protein
MRESGEGGREEGGERERGREGRREGRGRESILQSNANIYGVYVCTMYTPLIFSYNVVVAIHFGQAHFSKGIPFTSRHGNHNSKCFPF